MANEKIRKFGIGTADQSGFYFIGGRDFTGTNNRSLDDQVWSIKNSGISLCPASKREQGPYSGSGNVYCIYSQTATQFDRQGQKVCKIPGYIDWQSGHDSAGRIFSKKGSCPKQGDKLKHSIPLIGCVSKNSHRSTVFWSQTMIVIFRIFFLNH